MEAVLSATRTVQTVCPSFVFVAEPERMKCKKKMVHYGIQKSVATPIQIFVAA